MAETTEIVNQQNAHEQRQVSPPVRQIRVVEDNSVNACLLDTARFEHLQRIATTMAACALIPEHLLGRKKGQEIVWYDDKTVVGNCFLIVNQAIRWGFDPFAVAAETYVVGGKLGFQGKLIAALVNTRANLKSRLQYTFNGKQGDALEITVSGQFENDDEPRTVTMTVGQGRTSNSMWQNDAAQKLVYSGTIKWARRHCPEIIMGVFTDDDLDRIRDREKAIEAEPAKKLSNLIASGALKGDAEVPAEVDRRPSPKTRKTKAVETPAQTEAKPQQDEEQSHYEDSPQTHPAAKEEKPTSPSRMDECEAYAKKQGLSCIDATPDGTFAEYRLGNGKTIVFTVKEIASSDTRYCVLVTEEDATRQMVDIIEHARKQAAKGQ